MMTAIMKMIKATCLSRAKSKYKMNERMESITVAALRRCV